MKQLYATIISQSRLVEAIGDLIPMWKYHTSLMTIFHKERSHYKVVKISAENVEKYYNREKGKPFFLPKDQED